MWIIQHRVNMPSDLRALPRHHGAEVDLRYHCDDIVLAHDPYGHHRQEVVRFREWIAEWNHEGPLILNLKTEGLEDDCIALMLQRGVRNWFFLDMSPPYLVRFSLAAARRDIAGFSPENLAVRFSEHEPLDYALSFAGRAGWVWVDCFSHMPLDSRAAARLRKAGFRLCIVSPELQKHDPSRITEFRGILDGVQPDAVCTKRPDLWLPNSHPPERILA